MLSAYLDKTKRPNSDINQYAKGTLTQAPQDPVPIHSSVVNRYHKARTARPPPAERIHYGGEGVPLVPWLKTVFEAQSKSRELRFTPVPEYVKHDSNRENYLKVADAFQKHIEGNASEANRGVVNSQTLGLGNNRR